VSNYHEFGLKVEKPSNELYQVLRKIHQSFTEELKLLLPFAQHTLLGTSNTASFSEVRGLVESPGGGCYQFVTEGMLEKFSLQTPIGPQVGISEQRTFEGWRKLA
jgi:hypothetical protein